MQNSKEKTLSQRITERIIKYILEENLQPGDKLPNETVMCERLNVGRSSLREAMRALASRNVDHHTPRLRFICFRHSRDD